MKSLRLLEFDKVLALLCEQADSPRAKAMCAALAPTDDPDEAATRLDATGAALALINLRGGFSFRDIKDMDETFARIRVGAALSVSELLACAALLSCARRLKAFRGDDEKLAGALDDYFDRLTPDKGVETRISDSFTNDLEMADGASQELFSIRRAIINAQGRVRESLNKIIHSAKYARVLQEPVITIRSGRFVVPVKAEYKNEVSGLVHDVSSSGATLFIEPAAVVDANNEVRLLQSREQAEIERIMSELSELVFAIGGPMRDNYEACAAIDCAFARARLAIELHCMAPALNTRGIVDLRRARHPLLKRDTVVPISVAVGADYDTLVITGPNTGGKTVSLKLVGLMGAMAQSGLFIPADEGSSVCVFDTILTDVGDEQSIEQSLSTFSSHMTNIIGILKQATARSLCLFDELGAGTDPVEGAALSVAILEHIRAIGARVVCTTHYPELKVYALKTPGVRNASCEFDVATLRPTYRLITGMPGRSNAFAISERLGLDKSIIDAAAAHLTSDDIAFEEILARIEENRQASERDREAAARERAEAACARAGAQEKQKKLEAELDKQYEAARGQGIRIVESAKARINELLDEMENLVREKERADFKERVGAARIRAKGELRGIADDIDPVREVKNEYSLPRPLEIGDAVEVVGVAKSAVVASLPDAAGKLKVRAGVMTFDVSKDDLRLIKPPKTKKPYEASSGSAVRSGSMELNIIGQTVAEMEPQVLQFIDGAVMNGLTSVTIVHGKGTGTLRRAVSELLRGHPHVRSMRPGAYGEGDMGVTVVELKE